MNKTQLSESQYNEMALAFTQAAALVKTTVGVGNNAAWMACLDAFDHIRQHPAYRHKVKAAYKKAFEALKAYERDLVCASSFRFFHVDDMSPEVRKVYGDITDREYYDFWAAFGHTAYADNYPFYSCLVNKLRLAYLHNNVPYADILAWSKAARWCLGMAGNIYQSAIRRCAEAEEWRHIGVTHKGWEKVFASFDISHVAHLWDNAHQLLAGHIRVHLSEAERRNIEMGYQQLMEKWLDEETLFGSRIKTCDDYAEVFRTNGERKKAQRQFAEMRDEVKRYNNSYNQ